MKNIQLIYTVLLTALFTLSASAFEFNEKVKPFLNKFCLDCHDDETQKGDIALHDLKGITVENAELWKQIWEQVALAEMPPRKKKTQPELTTRLIISNMITDELTRVLKPKGGFTSHLHPLKGNHLNHDLLFNTKHENLIPTSSPARIWRIHPQLS